MSKRGTHRNQKLQGISTCNVKIIGGVKSEFQPQDGKEIAKIQTHNHRLLQRKGNIGVTTRCSFFQPFNPTLETKSSWTALWSALGCRGREKKGLYLCVNTPPFNPDHS